MTYHYKNGSMHVEDVSLAQIATKVSTPCYVYSAGVIADQYARLKGAMEKALPKNRQPLLCFACKANSNVAVLSLLRSFGSGLEIISEGELLRGLKAGFDPSKIVSTGVGKQHREIATALRAGILQFNVESIPELAVINEVAGSL
ncbi:MAG: diaminopimelate decarboxylase, partial [Micavibrio aeruginosavorus]